MNRVLSKEVALQSWDRRRARLRGSNRTHHIYRSACIIVVGSVRHGQARTPAVPALRGYSFAKALNKVTTVVIVLSLVASSVAAQKTAPPQVTIPDTFRGADSTAPTNQTSIGDLKWFDIFKDEELQKLVRTAMVRNYDLQAAVA